MKLKQQRKYGESNERAVSPVIGVILMVAITVILAAVIGAFVLGLGDTVQDTAPNANFDFDLDTENDNLEITHVGGDSLDADDISIVVGDGDPEGWEGTDITAGESHTVTELDSDNQGDTVRVIWESGGQSSTLATYEIPDDADLGT